MRDIYHNIKKIISEKKAITQNDIAEQLNVSRNTVSNWMNKGIGIKAEQVPLIAKALHCSVSELYGEDSNIKTIEEPSHRKESNDELKAYLKDQVREKDLRIIELEKELEITKRKKAPYQIAAEE